MNDGMSRNRCRIWRVFPLWNWVRLWILRQLLNFSCIGAVFCYVFARQLFGVSFWRWLPPRWQWFRPRLCWALNKKTCTWLLVYFMSLGSHWLSCGSACPGLFSCIWRLSFSCIWPFGWMICMKHPIYMQRPWCINGLDTTFGSHFIQRGLDLWLHRKASDVPLEIRLRSQSG